MLKISINRLADIDLIQDLEILSIDCALYTVRVVIQSQQYRVVDKNDKPYVKSSVELIKKDLQDCHIANIALVHQSLLMRWWVSLIENPVMLLGCH